MRNQNTKYSRLATTGSPSRDSTKTNSVSSTQELLQNQIRQQEHLVNHQDAQLSQMSQSVGTLRNMSSAIGSELDEQAVMLDEFGGKNYIFNTKQFDKFLSSSLRSQFNLLFSKTRQITTNFPNMSSAIGSELVEQAVMLDEFGGKNYIF